MNASIARWCLVVAAATAAAVSARPDTAPPSWHASIAVAAGRAEQGPWRQNESRYDYVDDPAVAIDAGGGIAVAWVDQARRAVLLQRFAADGGTLFAQPVDVSRQPRTFSWLPRLAFAPDAPQRLYVLWQEIVFSGGSHGGEMMFARSDDGGRSFAPPLNLSRSTGGDGKGRINREVWHNGSFDLAAGPDGVLHVAWTEYDGPLWHARSTDGGATFSAPRRIADSGPRQPARGPSLALGPDAAVYLAWTVGDDAGADIRLARSRDGGATFDGPTLVAASNTYSDAPTLAVDAAGVLHLAYHETAGGPFERSHIRYTSSRDGGLRFAAPREVSAPAPASAVSAAFPAVGVDAAGTVVVSWESYPDRRQPPRGLGIAVSRDGGRTFTAPALVPDSADPAGGFNGSRQGLLMRKLAVGRDGTLAIVNSSFRHGVASRVWLMRAALAR